MLAMDYSELHIPLSVKFGVDALRLQRCIQDRYEQLDGVAFRSAGRGEAAVIAGLIDLLKQEGEVHSVAVVGDSEMAQWLGAATDTVTADVVVVAGYADLLSVKARWLVVCESWKRQVPSELYGLFKSYFEGGAFDDARGVIIGFTGADIRVSGVDAGVVAESDRQRSSAESENRNRVVGRKRVSKEEEVPSATGVSDTSGVSEE